MVFSSLIFLYGFFSLSLLAYSLCRGRKAQNWVLLVFSLRYKKADGWKTGLLVFWLACLALLAGAGYMEYYVQRHSGEAAFSYSVMSLCMALVLLLGTILWAVTRKREIPRSLPTIYPKVV